jgi:hypothetical protein
MAKKTIKKSDLIQTTHKAIEERDNFIKKFGGKKAEETGKAMIAGFRLMAEQQEKFQ